MTILLVTGAVLLGGIVLFLLWDWFRERRDLARHLARIAERKEAFERFKQKKRNSQEITKPKPGPSAKPKAR